MFLNFYLCEKEGAVKERGEREIERVFKRYNLFLFISRSFVDFIDFVFCLFCLFCFF